MFWFGPLAPGSAALLAVNTSPIISRVVGTSSLASTWRATARRTATILGVSAAVIRTGMPQILGKTKGTDSSDLTTHTATYPTGIKNGELLILMEVSNGTPTLTSPSGWRGVSQASGGMTSRVCYRYATGEETGTFTFTTSVAERCSWIVLRCSKNTIINHHLFSTGTATTSVTNARYRAGATSKESLLLVFLAANLAALPTGVSSGYTLVDSQAGDAATGCSAYIQKLEYTSIANTEETPATQTLSVSSDYVSRMISLTLVKPSNKVFGFWHDHGNSGADLNSTTPVRGAGQSFVGDGGRIERIGVNLRKSAAVTGTIRLKVYALSGTYNDTGTAIPTGTALATATTTIDPVNLSTAVWQYEEFIFSTPFITANNEAYFFTIEVSDISGGNIRVARAGSTTGKGNGAASADLITWTATGTEQNDLVHFIQFIKESPYKFKTNNSRLATPTNNVIDGWEAIEEHPHIQDLSVTSASTTYVIQEKAVVDGKNVWHGRSIDDLAGGSTERAQISIEWYNQAEQDAVYHFRTRMKLHVDLDYLRINYTDAIGNGTAWIDFWEIWLQHVPAWDGDTAGAARWNINLRKAAGTNQPYYWRLTGEFMQPLASQFVAMWFEDNVSIPIKCDTWFHLDVYMKVGEGVNGRMTVKIRYEGEQEQTLFDVTDTTLYYEGEPQIKLGSFNPIKVYTSDTILDWMASNSKLFTMYLAEFTWFDDTMALPPTTAIDTDITGVGMTSNTWRAIARKTAALTSTTATQGTARAKALRTASLAGLGAVVSQPRGRTNLSVKPTSLTTIQSLLTFTIAQTWITKMVGVSTGASSLRGRGSIITKVAGDAKGTSLARGKTTLLAKALGDANIQATGRRRVLINSKVLGTTIMVDVLRGRGRVTSKVIAEALARGTSRGRTNLVTKAAGYGFLVSIYTKPFKVAFASITFVQPVSRGRGRITSKVTGDSISISQVRGRTSVITKLLGIAEGKASLAGKKLLIAKALGDATVRALIQSSTSLFTKFISESLLRAISRGRAATSSKLLSTSSINSLIRGRFILEVDFSSITLAEALLIIQQPTLNTIFTPSSSLQSFLSGRAQVSSELTTIGLFQILDDKRTVVFQGTLTLVDPLTMTEVENKVKVSEVAIVKTILIN